MSQKREKEIEDITQAWIDKSIYDGEVCNCVEEVKNALDTAIQSHIDKEYIRRDLSPLEECARCCHENQETLERWFVKWAKDNGYIRRDEVGIDEYELLNLITEQNGDQLIFSQRHFLTKAISLSKEVLTFGKEKK